MRRIHRLLMAALLLVAPALQAQGWIEVANSYNFV